MKQCSKCNKNIDTSACNDRYSTMNINDDRTGKTIKTKYIFCSFCTLRITTAIFDDSLIV